MASVVRQATSDRALITTDEENQFTSTGDPLATYSARISAATVSTISSGFTTAAAPIVYTVITSTQLSVLPEGTTRSTITFITASTVTDSLQYASITSAAAASKTHITTSTHASSTTASSSSSAKASSNMSTIIPAVVAPVAIVLIATFAAFWFFMRRRHRRDLQSQPAFIMAAKTEKLASTTSSLSSDHKDYGPSKETLVASPASASTEKPLPSTNSRERSPRPPKSSSSTSRDYPRENTGLPRTSNIRDEQRPSPHLPAIRTDSSPNTRYIANFTNNPNSSPNYSPHTIRSANPHLAGGSQTPHNSVIPAPKNISGRGPPAGVGTSNHVLSRNRSQSLTSPQSATRNRSNSNMNNPYNSSSPQAYRPPTAPTSDVRGAPRDFSPSRPLPPIRQTQQRSFSPVGNRAPPPAPIKAPLPPSTTSGFLNQPLYSPIIRDVPSKAKRPSVIVPKTQDRGFSIGSHISPLLPSPQSDNRRDPNLTAENLRIARLANTSRLGFDSPTGDRDTDNISEISATDHNELNEDAKSDVSSLDEFQKLEFDFEQTRGGSRSGSALDSIPGGRSGSSMNSYSPVLGPASGRPWR